MASSRLRGYALSNLTTFGPWLCYRGPLTVPSPLHPRISTLHGCELTQAMRVAGAIGAGYVHHRCYDCRSGEGAMAQPASEVCATDSEV